MTSNTWNILAIRKLIQNERYIEALTLMRQTNHPQIPALERQLMALLEAQTPPIPQRMLMLWRGVIGLMVAGLLINLIYHAGYTAGIGLFAAGLLGFVGGVYAIRLPAIKDDPTPLNYAPPRQTRWI